MCTPRGCLHRRKGAVGVRERGRAGAVWVVWIVWALGHHEAVVLRHLTRLPRHPRAALSAFVRWLLHAALTCLPGVLGPHEDALQLLFRLGPLATCAQPRANLAVHVGAAVRGREAREDALLRGASRIGRKGRRCGASVPRLARLRVARFACKRYGRRECVEALHLAWRGVRASASNGAAEGKRSQRGARSKRVG